MSLESKIDYVWHRWINDFAEPQRGDWKGPCVWCGKLLDEHGSTSRHGRLCPEHDSQYFTPKPYKFDKEHPNVGTLYAFKSAIQMLGWAGKMIEKARTGKLPTMHQHCSHCEPEPIKHNTARCWLGKDLATCEILTSLWQSADAERKRTLLDGRSSYYADIPDAELYRIMGYTCVWHLLMSHVATTKDELPPPSFVDFNEGAIFDESDQMFWDRVYDSMTEWMREP